MTSTGKRSWPRWWWVVLLAVVLAGLAGRSIMARKNAQQALVEASQGAQAVQALKLTPSDWFTLAPVKLVATVPVSGSIMAVDRVVIKSRVAGELLSLTVREGDAVRRGQLLGRVNTDEYRSRLEQADQQAASAKAQWQMAQRTLENNQALVAQGFISKNALDNASSNAAAAKATMQAAIAGAQVARKALNDTQLLSPLDGLVAQQFVQAGERVMVDTRVLEVVNLNRMEMETSLQPEDVARVKIGAQAHLKVDGLAGEVVAQVVRINPSADAVSRAVTIYLSVTPQAALRHGLFARGQLQLDQMDTLALPASAVKRNSQGTFVQLLQTGADGHSRVVHRPVKLGANGWPEPALSQAQTTGAAGDVFVSVLSGLNEGDRVLQGSLGLLRDDTPVDLKAAR